MLYIKMDKIKLRIIRIINDRHKHFCTHRMINLKG